MRRPSATAIPKHFYVFGGVDGFFNLSTNAWRYDAVSNTWSGLAPMPEGFEASAAACDAGRVHVLGGSGTDAHFIYDIGSDSWSFGATLPRPVEGAAAAAWDGHVYLIGGDDDFDPGNGVSNEVDIYDAASDSWTGTGAALPTATGNMGYAQVGSTVYLAGGWVDFTDARCHQYRRDPGVRHHRRRVVQRTGPRHGASRPCPCGDGQCDLRAGRRRAGCRLLRADGRRRTARDRLVAGWRMADHRCPADPGHE